LADSRLQLAIQARELFYIFKTAAFSEDPIEIIANRELSTATMFKIVGKCKQDKAIYSGFSR
jgi:hypothetical protein